MVFYPLVNVDIAMDNHHVSWVKPTISMAMFNSELVVYQSSLWDRGMDGGSWEEVGEDVGETRSPKDG